MKKWQNTLSFGFFALGLILLALLVRKVGLAAITETFFKLGPNLIWVLLFPATWYFLQALAWHRVLKDDKHDASLWHVFLAKITGEAINTVTPASVAAGDPYRIYLLQKKTSKTTSTASVVVDRTLHTIGIFFTLITGLAVGWLSMPLPPAWRWILPGVLVGFTLVLWLLVASQKKGLFSTLSKILQKWGVQRARLERIDHKLLALDGQIRGFYDKSHVHFFEVVGYHTVSRLLGAVEIWFIVRFLGLPVTFAHCLVLTTLTILVNAAFVFIPGAMGVMEGGYGAIFYLLHLDPIMGVSIQLVRRVRTFFWIFLGLVIIALYRPQKSDARTMP